MHRSDTEIFVDARKALDHCLSIPQGVRVHVDHGTVTLTGSVRLVHEKGEAEDVVRRIEGVQRLLNHISVAQEPDPEGFERPE
jgi:osmotically-inducible protein OsmY